MPLILLYHRTRRPSIQKDGKEPLLEVRFNKGALPLILCRNLVFTYFEEALQREILRRMMEKLHDGGIFVIGIRESLPEGVTGLTRFEKMSWIYRKL